MSRPEQQSPGAQLAARIARQQQHREAEAPASRQEMTRGFRSLRQELYETQRWLREALVRLARVEKVLHSQRMSGDADSDGFRREALVALSRADNPVGLGLRLDGNQQDKYEVQPSAPDCERRLPVCRALCCYLPFPLAKQDVDEGEVTWSEDYPFQLARADGRRCLHLDPSTLRCTVYGKRPRICRTFDCRTDRRVWRDYDGMVLTPWAENIVAQHGPDPEWDWDR